MLLAMLSLLQVQAFVGGDRDGHGCCGSCGYHYSNTCSKCMHVSRPTKTCPPAVVALGLLPLAPCGPNGSRFTIARRPQPRVGGAEV